MESRIAEQPDNVQQKGELIKLYFSNEQFDDLITFYEENENSFSDYPLIQSYYGATLASKAGTSNKIEDQMKWVKKSMIILDGLVQEYPDDYEVFLWRGMTYSHLPSILNAKSIVEGDLELVRNNYRDGVWNVPDSDKEILYMAYLFLAEQYDDENIYKDAFEELKEDLADPNYSIFESYRNFKL